MLIFHYTTKKELKQSVGNRLRFSETSLFGPEYSDNCTCYGTNHPKRTWFAKVTVKNGLISKVE